MTHPGLTCVPYVKADLSENHFQVTPSSKTIQNMSAQVSMAFKVSLGGLRKAMRSPGSCIVLQKLDTHTKERKKII